MQYDGCVVGASCSEAGDVSVLDVSDALVQPRAIVGVIQKGPFIRGTTITVQELDAKLSPTGRTFDVTTTDDLGGFDVPVKLASRYVEVIATGYYYDELLDELSPGALTLRAISDVQVDGTVHVNLLTSMSSIVLRRLVGEGQSFADARRIAESAVLDALGLSLPSTATFDKLDVVAAGDDNALLLAASLLLEKYAQSFGDSEVAEITQLVSQIGSSVSDAGGASSALSGFRSTRCATAGAIDAANVRSNLSAHYASFGVTVDVPPFESVINAISANCRGDGGVTDAAGETDVLVDGDGATNDGGPAAIWQQKMPATSPSKRTAVLAYDKARGVSVLFGGWGSGSLADGGNGVLGDTWEWDGTNWTQRFPARSPAARERHALAYDDATQRVVLFGGSTTGAAAATVSDTWEWDGVNWSPKPSSKIPDARFGAALAYDGVSGKLLLFGGVDANNVYLNDTWEWDGMNWSVTTTVAAPHVRYLGPLAWDSARGRIVLFGGTDDGSIGPMADTWEWDGMNWKDVSPPASPPKRYASALAYDSARARTVLFGGGPSSVDNDTWEWDGANWMQITSESSPAARSYAGMTYDEKRGRMVLFGGDIAGGDITNDTWEYFVR
jgi:hypothetical protein